MSVPRETVQYGVPVDYLTGRPLSPGQMSRIDRIREAYDAVRAVLHESEGTDPGNPQFSTRTMSLAATNLETSQMYAMRAALEHK